MKTIGELKEGDKAYYYNRTRNCLIEFEIDRISKNSGFGDFFSVYIKGGELLNIQRGLPPLGFNIHKKYFNRTASRSISTINSNESIKEIENNCLSYTFYNHNKRFRCFIEKIF